MIKLILLNHYILPKYPLGFEFLKLIKETGISIPIHPNLNSDS